MAISAQTPAESQVEGTRELRLPEEVPEAPREQSPIRLIVCELANVPGANEQVALEPLETSAGRDEVQGKLGEVNGVANKGFEARAGEFYVLIAPADPENPKFISPLRHVTEAAASTILLSECRCCLFTAPTNADFDLTLGCRPVSNQQEKAFEALD